MKLDLNFLVPLLGAAFVFIGIYIRMGNIKQVYWKSRRSVFGYIPLGLVFILAGYFDQVSKLAPIYYYAYTALFVLVVAATLFISARPPNFIKPDWIVWIEKHPASIQKAMQAEVQENTGWEQKVSNEAEVDAWARQLSRKLPKKK